MTAGDLSPVGQPEPPIGDDPRVPAERAADEISGRLPLGDPFVSQFMARFGSPTPSLIDKATTEQLGELIRQADDSDKRSATLYTKVLNRVTLFAIVIVVAILLLCWMFLTFQKADALQQIVTLIVGLSGGSVGGFGVGRLTADRAA